MRFDEIPAFGAEGAEEARMPPGVGLLMVLGASALFWAIVILALA